MSVRVCFDVPAMRQMDVDDARLAVLAWLYARHEGGTFILRVEDVDSRVATAGAVDVACDALAWLGLDWDDGPIRQSGRLEVYRRYACQLSEAGHAYPCVCAPEEDAPGAHCRCVGRAGAMPGEPHALRYRLPERGPVSWEDLVLGTQTFDLCALPDPLLLTADGTPSRLLVGVVDDRAASATHAFRAQERLPESALSLLLHRALGGDPPRFAHLPPVDYGSATPSLAEAREQGYLGLAFANCLTRLGWTPRGRRALLPLPVLAERLDLARVSRRPAALDEGQLRWFGRRGWRQLDVDEAASLLVPRWQAAYGVTDRAEGTGLSAEEWQRALAVAVRDEISCAAEAVDKARFAFVDRLDADADAEAGRALAQPYVGEVLCAFAQEIPRVEPWTFEAIDAAVSGLRWRFKASLGIRSRDVMHALRAALTGRADGPCLVATCQLLGRRRCVARAEVRARMAS